LKVLVILAALVVLLGTLLLSNIADTSIPDDVVTGSEADKSDSASATITITMYALPEEEWS